MEVVLNVSTNGYISGKGINHPFTSQTQKPYKTVNCVQTITSLDNNLVEIDIKNVNATVPLGFKKGKKTILHDISGKFPSGQLTAIIGPSGAGKTTLLEILSGYRISGIEGIISVNGELRNLQTFKKSSCYITHDNHLQPLLTVWENMEIAADLKLGLGVSQDDKGTIIKEILSTLSMETSIHTRASELSGGQQKRLSIALELISDPDVMFFDEPTTGLDSLSCSQCVKLLRRLTRQGKTIVCTIHQASTTLVQLFDQVYVLGNGKCLYQGSTPNLVYFLDYVGLSCPMYHSPIDYVIELISGECKKQNIEIMTKAIENGENFQWLEQPAHLTELRKLKEIETRSFEYTLEYNPFKRIPQYDQMKILFKRGLIKYQRDSKLTYMRLVVNILTGLLYGVLYWQSGTDADKVRINYSCLYCVLTHHIMSTLILSIITFPNETSILTKEHFNRWYSLKSYFIATTITDIPILVMCCLLFTGIVYPMTGQPLEIDRLGMFTTISLLIVLVVQSFGLIIGSIFNVMNGTFVGFALTVTMILLAGIGEDLKDLPVNFHWASYISYMKYGLEGIVSAIYGNERPPIYCPEDRYCHYKYPKKFLKDVGIKGDQFWVSVFALCCILLVCRLGAYLVLKWRLVNSR